MNAGEIRGQLDALAPPAGRNRLTNAQRLQVLQIEATLLLAEEQRTTNLLAVIGGSAALVEDDDFARTGKTPHTRDRAERRNRLRAQVRALLGWDG